MIKCIMSGCGKPLTKKNRVYSLEDIRENPYNAICKECANKYPVHYSYNGHVVTKEEK